MQMYKVFNENKAIIFTQDKKIAQVNANQLWIKYENTINLLLQIESFKALHDVDELLVCCDNNIENIYADFISNYFLIEASGGFVLNKKNELLMIYRNNKWDLPKGKIEDGEAAKQAGLREVEEETGVEDLEIISNMPPTFHLYTMNGVDYLKKTWWYEMKTSYEGNLVPQNEEGITKAVWCNHVQTKKNIPFAYHSLHDNLALILPKIS